MKSNISVTGKILYPFLISILFVSQMNAQALCSQDSLLNTKGTWIKGGDWTGLNINYPAADKQAMVKIQDRGCHFTMDRLKDLISFIPVI